jgi:hypothetical protein
LNKGEAVRRFSILQAIVTVLAVAACGGATKTVVQTVTAPPSSSSADTSNTAPTAADTRTTDTTGADTNGTDTTGIAATETSSSDSGGGPIPSVPVGTNQTLSADQENDQIDTTVTAVQDLAPDQFNTPDRGKHYVGVFLKLRNLGNTVFNDAPGNDITLITNKGDTISSDLANVGGCSNSGDLKVGPGESLRTCVTFQEPNDQTFKTVQVSLDSGNDPPGEWTRP